MNLHLRLCSRTSLAFPYGSLWVFLGKSKGCFFTHSAMCDAFLLLGLNPSFDLSHPELDQRFQEAQTQCHPDMQISWLAKQGSQRLSAQLNQAYQTLKCPKMRAECLMKTLGMWPPVASPAFLESLLEEPSWPLEETLEECSRAFKTQKEASIAMAYWKLCYVMRTAHKS